MASQQNSRATSRDTSPGHWFLRIPNTLFPTARPALRSSLNLVQKQPTRTREELGSFSTCRDYTDRSDENDNSDSTPCVHFVDHLARSGRRGCPGCLHRSSRREGEHCR